MKNTFKNQFMYEETLGIENKINALKEALKVDDVNALNWYQKDRLTAAQYDHLKNGNLKRFKELVRKQIKKEEVKKQTVKNECLLKIQDMKEAGSLNHLKITVEWSRSQTWGYNPHAQAWAQYTNIGTLYNTGSASGCGYDKESAAVASAINDILKPFMLKHFSTLKDPAIYGVCDHALCFDGGVGMSSFVKAFRACGYDVYESHGKAFNSYIIVKKGLKNE